MQVNIGHAIFVDLIELEARRIIHICQENTKVLAKPDALKVRVDEMKKLCDQWPVGT